jgi:hypothetical protein
MLTRNLLRIDARCVWLLALAVPSSLASQATAQTPPAAVVPDDSAPCTPGVRSSVGFGTINVSDAPYSGTWKVTFDQKLPDGRAIHGVTRTLSARSSDGKLLTEASTACSLDENGHVVQQLSIHVLDPARGTILDWTVGAAVLKVAHLVYQKGQFTSETGISEWPLGETRSSVPGRSVTTSRVESLGTKMIAGVKANGQRLTATTVSLNAPGDARPSVGTQERWISIEHGLLLWDIIDDPDRGRTEGVMENLSLKEPDPSLFLPPDGYKVIETFPKTTAAK